MCALKYEAIFELLSLDSFSIYRLLILEERRKVRDKEFSNVSSSFHHGRWNGTDLGRREGEREIVSRGEEIRFGVVVFR